MAGVEIPRTALAESSTAHLTCLWYQTEEACSEDGLACRKRVGSARR
jgi:hypothetical protein